jgi:hypothetical protein
MHKDIGVPFFEVHTRVLTEINDIKRDGMGNP